MIAYCGYTFGKMSVNGASTISGHVNRLVENWFGRGDTESKYWPPLLVKIVLTRTLPPLTMSVNRVSMIFCHTSWVIRMPIGCRQSLKNHLPPLKVQQIAIPSLTHLEHENHRSVNNCWSCMLGNPWGDRWQTVMDEVMAAVIEQRGTDMLPAPYWRWASTERPRLLAIPHG